MKGFLERSLTEFNGVLTDLTDLLTFMELDLRFKDCRKGFKERFCQRTQSASEGRTERVLAAFAI